MLEQRGAYGLYQTKALPRFYFATQSRLEYGDMADYMAKIGTVDLGSYPVLTSFSSWVSDPSAPVGSKACIQGEASFSHNRLRMSAQCSHTAILVVNEFDNGNWRATVNGVKARMLRVNYNQIGIVVGPGTTLIDVYYHPRIWRISLWLAVLALFSLLIYIGIWHSKRRISAIHSPLATIAAAP